MTDERPTEAEPTGEEAPERPAEQVAGKAGDHEFPTLGRAGDMTSDDESLARRPAEHEGDEAKADPEAGGPPPASTTPGT